MSDEMYAGLEAIRAAASIRGQQRRKASLLVRDEAQEIAIANDLLLVFHSDVLDVVKAAVAKIEAAKTVGG